MKIGVAGLGAMGANIAARLIEVGHEVHVWNRTAAKAKPLAEAGADVAHSPTELAGLCDTVITILTMARPSKMSIRALTVCSPAMSRASCSLK